MAVESSEQVVSASTEDHPAQRANSKLDAIQETARALIGSENRGVLPLVRLQEIILNAEHVRDEISHITPIAESRPVAVSTVTGRLAYRPREAAEQLGISLSKMYKMLDSGEVPSFRAGRAVRVSHAALVSWIAKQESRE